MRHDSDSRKCNCEYLIRQSKGRYKAFSQGKLLRSDYVKRPVLSATIHPDLKRTLVAMSKRTGMSVSQVTDEVLYTGLIEMQELPEHEE